MDITDPEPQETAKTQCITVEGEPKDTSTKGSSMAGADGFLPSKKTARSPPQAKAQPITRIKHAPPQAPRPPTRVKKLEWSDLAEVEDDTEEEPETSSNSKVPPPGPYQDLSVTFQSYFVLD